MIGVALKSLWGRKLRTLLTALSIVLGTTMIAGTFVVRDQITNAFTSIFETGLEKTDVLLSKKTAFGSDNSQSGPLPASDIAAAAAVPGVAKAEGQIQAQGALVVNGKYTASSGPSFVFSTLSDTFSPYNYVAGRPPQQSGEVVVNQQMARDRHLRVGQHALLATEVGTRPVTIVGVFRYGQVSSIGGATIVGTTFADAQAWFDRPGLTSLVFVKADPGVSQVELQRRLTAALSHDVKVQTGPEAAKQQTDQTAGGVTGFLTPLLLAFAFTAVLVGAFIIFNTFSITVAHRTREFAILRTLGASRRQVLRSVLLEATVVGLLASALGIVLGIGFAKLLGVLFDAVGFGLPSTAIRIAPLTVIVLPLAVGTGTALLSAIAPAFRATRIPPIAALREGAELPPSVLARRATPIAGLILAAGLGGIWDGIFNDGSVLGAVLGLGKTADILLSMGIGAILCFLSVAMLSKHVVRPLARLFGMPLEWIVYAGQRLAALLRRIPRALPLLRALAIARRAVFQVRVVLSALQLVLTIASLLLIASGDAVAGVLLLAIGSAAIGYSLRRIWRKPRPDLEWPPETPTRETGRLARENTTRNTARTATTASALMIGVGLVVFVAVFVNGFKDSFLGALDHSISSDLIVQSDSFSSIPKQAVQAAGAVPDVQVAAGIQFTEAKIGHGGTDVINGIDPTTIAQVYTFNWQQGGSNDLLGRFSGNEALIEQQFAKSHHLSVGDHFQVTSIEGNHLDLEVIGQYKDPTLMPGFTVPSLTLDSFTTNSDPGVLLVSFKQGVPLDRGKAEVARALRAFPEAKVRTNAEYKAHTDSQVSGFLNFLYVLLAMSLIISLFGIVNTLALSVFERTREIGMLRAVGTTRRQLRRMIRYEAIITSAIGGLLGVVVGLVFGWILSKGLADQGISFSIPYSLLVVVLIGAVIAGVLSAILPARRAARLDVLEALQYE